MFIKKRRKNYFEKPQMIEPEMVKIKPRIRNIKFLEPFTSLYNKTPQSEEITDGPLDTIGKVTAWERALFATKNEQLPIAHITPLKFILIN